MRLLLLLACFVLTPHLVSAEDLPKPQVADPFGLGERLALVDYLRETCKLTPPPDATMEQLVAMYWTHHRKEREELQNHATDQALAADRIRRIRQELKERFQIDAPVDADETTLGGMLNSARTKVTGEAVQQVLDKAAARDNPATPEEAARFAEQDRDAARLRLGRIDQDEKSARAEQAQIDEQRRALAKQVLPLEEELVKRQDAYNGTIKKHNQLVVLYEQKSRDGSPDALTVLEQINNQKTVMSTAQAAVSAQEAEIQALMKKDDALLVRRKRVDEILGGIDQRRGDEQRKGSAVSPAVGGPATPGGIAALPAAGSQQARLIAGVVLLVVKDVGTGTGFFVSRDGLVVTNAHVLKNPRASVFAMWDAGAKRRPVRMRVIDYAEADDLALLKAEEGAPFDPLAMQEVYEIQRPLISAGFPLAGSVADTLQTSPSDIVVSRGILGSVRRSDNRVEWLQHDCRVSSGNSGGPVIDQQTGTVIGVTTMVLQTDGVQSFGDGINLAVPIRKVMDRFAAHLKP